MNKKINIEQLELLLPDYITGNISVSNKKLVEDGMNSSPELAKLYSQMQNALGFVKSVKFEEPAPQYWNNLLPRIHEKIDNRKGKSIFSFGSIWKILVPAAAVILIFIIFKIFSSNEPQFTKQEKHEKKNITIDTNSKIENKIEIKRDEDKTPELRDNQNIIKRKQRSFRNTDEKNYETIIPQTPEDKNIQRDNITPDEQIVSNDIPDLEDLVSIPAGEDIEAMYEESEKDFNQLSNNDKSEVIDKLKEINL